jgi:hypothetical protein
MSIWQEMVDRHGFTGAYESVKRFVRNPTKAFLPNDAPAVYHGNSYSGRVTSLNGLLNSTAYRLEVYFAHFIMEDRCTGT